jgi:magnesium transporter
MQAMRTIIWHNGTLTTLNRSARELQEVLQDEQALVWLDIWGEAMLYEELLRETFGISPLIMEMIDAEVERAKFLERASYCYLVVHGLDYNLATDEARLPEVDILFSKNFIVTIHRDELQWLDSLRREASMQGVEEQIMQRGMGYLLYEILDRQVDSYFPVLDSIDTIIDDLEDITVSNTSNEVQGRIFRIKRALAQMRRVISPQVEIMNNISMRSNNLISADLNPYFLSMHDHLLRAFEILDSYRDLMSGLLDVYLTTVSNRLNVVMKQLTIIATIFMPITFITGVFGQNFGHSPQVEHDAGANFWIVLVVMALITFGQIWYFRRRNWL